VDSVNLLLTQVKSDVSAVQVIQGHWFRYQSKARMRLPISPS